jgi:hypothetical protein
MKKIFRIAIITLILVHAAPVTAVASSYYQYGATTNGNAVHSSITNELRMRSTQNYNSSYQQNQIIDNLNTSSAYQQQMNNNRYYDHYTSGNNSQTQYNSGQYNSGQYNQYQQQQYNNPYNSQYNSGQYNSGQYR